jgi:NADH:ubiquinone oxidoreductase subunit B-like Fe-S oxidoreductase
MTPRSSFAGRGYWPKKATLACCKIELMRF